MSFLFNKKSSEHNTLVKAGKLFVIRAMPNLFTGELLNIGVCVIDTTGKRQVQVIKASGRLYCLYGQGADAVVRLAQSAGEAARLGLTSPSDSIIFDAPQPFYNQTPDDALANAFNDQVTIAAKNQKQRKNMSDNLKELKALQNNKTLCNRIKTELYFRISEEEKRVELQHTLESAVNNDIGVDYD